MRWVWLLPVLALSCGLCACGGCQSDRPAEPEPEITQPPPGPFPESSEREREAAVLRKEMVDTLVAEEEDLDPRVVAALRKVPRHAFVPSASLASAYNRRIALRIGEGQTISAPNIVAIMSSRLELKGTEKVLEIGTGSGYQAAVLAELVPVVHSIEIIRKLGERAEKRLKALGFDNVRVYIGDGYKGLPDEAPFDAIIVTAAPPETPPALLEQLAPGGRMIAPVGERHRTQWLTLHVKDADGKIHTRKDLPVRFVPMVHEDER